MRAAVMAEAVGRTPTLGKALESGTSSAPTKLRPEGRVTGLTAAPAAPFMVGALTWPETTWAKAPDDGPRSRAALINEARNFPAKGCDFFMLDILQAARLDVTAQV